MLNNTALQAIDNLFEAHDLGMIIAIDLLRHSKLGTRIGERSRRAVGDDLNESQLKMAHVPAGATLLDSGDLWFPLVIVENVYIFPGIPELLRKKFESARDRRVEPATPRGTGLLGRRSAR